VQRPTRATARVSRRAGVAKRALQASVATRERRQRRAVESPRRRRLTAAPVAFRCRHRERGGARAPKPLPFACAMSAWTSLRAWWYLLRRAALVEPSGEFSAKGAKIRGGDLGSCSDEQSVSECRKCFGALGGATPKRFLLENRGSGEKGPAVKPRWRSRKPAARPHETPAPHGPWMRCAESPLDLDLGTAVEGPARNLVSPALVCFGHLRSNYL
jgi:hypothetical protein